MMKKTLCCLLAVLCAVSLLCGCTDSTYGEQNAALVGVWQMTTRVTDEGETFDYTDNAVLFTYYDNNSGNKTIDGVEEYVFTYTYDGETLYTTAAYPDNRVNVMHDLVTIEGDTLTVYSFDEQAVITLKKIGVPPTKTTAATGA